MKKRSRKPVERFEPISIQQNRKLHAILKRGEVSEKALYDMVEKRIGIPSISSLSKREASWIIRRLEGSGDLVPPFPDSRFTDSRHPADLPNLAHIRGIRAIAKDLGWNKNHLKNWLKKYMKAGNIRALDSETARKAFIGLKKIRDGQKSRQ